jgi:PPE-repeat protein
MDFGTLPPEVNAGRIYSGPGPGALIDAATAWRRLARQLSDAGANCRSSASEPATQAAAAYLTWLDATAAQAGRAAAQAAAAVRAHESACVAMVPPPAIAANRVQRTSMAHANCLGQASQTIADTDAEYERMWFRNSVAMYAYAAASAEASRMPPFTPPPGTAVPEVLSAGRQVMSAIPQALQELSESPLASLGTCMSPVASAVSKLSSLSAPSDIAIDLLNSLNKAAALTFLLPSLKPNRGRVGGPALHAKFGGAASIGVLSAPHSWTTEAAINTAAVPPECGWHGQPIHLVKSGEPPR